MPAVMPYAGPKEEVNMIVLVLLAGIDNVSVFEEKVFAPEEFHTLTPFTATLAYSLQAPYEE